MKELSILKAIFTIGIVIAGFNKKDPPEADRSSNSIDYKTGIRDTLEE